MSTVTLFIIPKVLNSRNPTDTQSILHPPRHSVQRGGDSMGANDGIHG